MGKIWFYSMFYWHILLFKFTSEYFAPFPCTMTINYDRLNIAVILCVLYKTNRVSSLYRSCTMKWHRNLLVMLTSSLLILLVTSKYSTKLRIKLKATLVKWDYKKTKMSHTHFYAFSTFYCCCECSIKINTVNKINYYKLVKM